MKIENFKDKKILILGFGKEGRDTLKFLRKLFPKKKIGIADKNPKCKIKNLRFKNLNWHLGKNYLNSLKKYDLVIKSPGIPIHLPEIEKAFEEGKITSQTEVFFENFNGKIVGITGTKGKSTTSLLIYKILKASPKFKGKVFLTGNIGKPVLNHIFKKNAIMVYELSSHQLYNLKKSPQIAVILNFYHEHLDYYRNLKEYINAKSNITLHQAEKDYLIYNFLDRNVRKIAKKSKAKKIPLKNFLKIIKKVGVKKIPLPKFYALNIAAAIKVGEIFEVGKNTMRKVIENFRGLPHRLEFVGKFKGIYFYNDSLSTIPQSTIFALNSFDKKVKTLILGGFDRGLSFKKLAEEILKKKVKTLILFPETGIKIWEEILKKIKRNDNLPKCFLVQKMSDAVKLSFQYTPKSGICLLSPASASFNLFKDYKERGNLFKKYVKYYGKKS